MIWLDLLYIVVAVLFVGFDIWHDRKRAREFERFEKELLEMLRSNRG